MISRVFLPTLFSNFLAWCGMMTACVNAFFSGNPDSKFYYFPDTFGRQPWKLPQTRCHDKVFNPIQKIIFWCWTINCFIKWFIVHWRIRLVWKRKKNLWNQINQFHEKKIFFLAKFHFLQFQKWPKWKKYQTAKNVISRKKSRFSRFHEFFSLEFF